MEGDSARLAPRRATGGQGARPGRRSSLTGPDSYLGPFSGACLVPLLNSSRSVVKPEAVGSSSGWPRACDRSPARTAEAPMKGCCADAARRSHQSNRTWSCGELERSLSSLARTHPQASRLSCDRRGRLSVWLPAISCCPPQLEGNIIPKTRGEFHPRISFRSFQSTLPVMPKLNRALQSLPAIRNEVDRSAKWRTESVGSLRITDRPNLAKESPTI